MTEEWRPVVGYEGQYEVSSIGRVRSIPHRVKSHSGTERMTVPKMLTPSEMWNGYLRVNLSNKTRRTIHSLVAEAFIGPRPDGADVRHKNGDRADNRAANLEYGTRQENNRDCYAYGGRSGPGKLFSEDVVEIRRLIDSGLSLREIARRFGVSHKTIHNIKSGRTFSYIK